MADFVADGGIKDIQKGVSGIQSAMSNLKTVIPTEEMSSFNDTLYTLQKNANLSYRETSQLKNMFVQLSQGSRYAAKDFAVMSVAIQTNYTAMIALEKGTTNYLRLLTTAFPKGAEEANRAMLNLQKRIPDLFDSMKKGQNDIGTLWEVFKEGGEEGVAIYEKLIAVSKKGMDPKNINEFSLAIKNYRKNVEDARREMGELLNKTGAGKVIGSKPAGYAGAIGESVAPALGAAANVAMLLGGMKMMGVGGKFLGKIPGMGGAAATATNMMSAQTINVTGSTVNVAGGGGFDNLEVVNENKAAEYDEYAISPKSGKNAYNMAKEMFPMGPSFSEKFLPFLGKERSLTGGASSTLQFAKGIPGSAVNLAKAGWGGAASWGATGLGAAGALGIGSAVGAGAGIGLGAGWLFNKATGLDKANEKAGIKGTWDANVKFFSGLGSGGHGMSVEEQKTKNLSRLAKKAQDVGYAVETYGVQEETRKKQGEMAFKRTGNAQAAYELERAGGEVLSKQVKAQEEIVNALERKKGKERDNKAIAEERNKLAGYQLELMNKEVNAAQKLYERQSQLTAIEAKRIAIAKELGDFFGRSPEEAKEQAQKTTANARKELADAKRNTLAMSVHGFESPQFLDAKTKEEEKAAAVRKSAATEAFADTQQRLENLSKEKDESNAVLANTKATYQTTKELTSAAEQYATKTEQIAAGEKSRYEKMKAEGITGAPLTEAAARMRSSQTEAMEARRGASTIGVQTRIEAAGQQQALLEIAQSNAEMMKDSKLQATYTLELRKNAMEQLGLAKEEYETMKGQNRTPLEMNKQLTKIAQLQQNVIKYQDQYRRSWEEKFTEFATRNIGQGTYIYRGQTSKMAQMGGAFQAWRGESRDEEGNLLGIGTRQNLAARMGGGYENKAQQDMVKYLAGIDTKLGVMVDQPSM